MRQRSLSLREITSVFEPYANLPRPLQVVCTAARIPRFVLLTPYVDLGMMEGYSGQIEWFVRQTTNRTPRPEHKGAGPAAMFTVPIWMSLLRSNMNGMAGYLEWIVMCFLISLLRL